MLYPGPDGSRTRRFDPCKPLTRTPHVQKEEEFTASLSLYKMSIAYKHKRSLFFLSRRVPLQQSLCFSSRAMLSL